MTEELRLLGVFAHPDDETLGIGGLLAKYAHEGVDAYIITATLGQRGWPADPADNPGPDELGRIRRDELDAATSILNLKEVTVLDYMDGELDSVDQHQIIQVIAAHIMRIRPQVVITFDPFGVYGHPDHIAISQFTTAAIVEAAAPDGIESSEYAPHKVSKLYYLAETDRNLEIHEDAFGDLVMHIDGVERRPNGWPEWAITTQIDTSDYYGQVWQAVYCHRSQLPSFQALLDLPDGRCEQFFSRVNLYRAFSLVNGGRDIETDIFAGLR